MRRLYSLLPRNDTFDMIIIDYDINDCAVLVDTKESRIQLQSCTEALIRRSLLHKSNPAVIFLNIASSHYRGNILGYTCGTYHTCFMIGEVRLPILKAYGVPMISHRAAVWTNFSCLVPSSIWPCG